MDAMQRYPSGAALRTEGAQRDEGVRGTSGLPSDPIRRIAARAAPTGGSMGPISQSRPALALNSAVVLTCGNGSSGASTPRNRHSGRQPAGKSNTKS